MNGCSEEEELESLGSEVVVIAWRAAQNCRRKLSLFIHRTTFSTSHLLTTGSTASSKKNGFRTVPSPA